MLRIPGISKTLAGASLAALLLVVPACGGGGGGPGPDGAGQGLTLVSFLQNGVGNLSLNQALEFRFSEAVDPASVTVASLQLREGPAFGSAVTGTLTVNGSTVFFEPSLPGRCDLSDSGFKPDRQYRVTIVGYPEQFSIKNTQGQPLNYTQNFEFHTRPDTDSLMFLDQVAGAQPVVTSTDPQGGTAVVRIETTPGLKNELLVQFSENLNPCTVSDFTVRLFEYQRGDPTRFLNDPASGRKSGFSPITDGDVGNPYSWGPIDAGETNLGANPQRIRAILSLEQSFTQTLLRITPEFGQFPENSLCVLDLTFGIRDFGGNSLVPFTCAFTTENLGAQSGTYIARFADSVPPILVDDTTADVDTVRSPDRAQAWMLFAGDGDNGTNVLLPTLPNIPPACTIPRQPNAGGKDPFDTLTVGANPNLDSGLTANTCPNKTDGSTAVVWEFQSLRIRAGHTVRVVGVNPAIILVQTSAQIDTGGRLLGRGDGQNGTNNANGSNAILTDSQQVIPGGTGYAGGGKGGDAYYDSYPNSYADSGRTGYGSPAGYNVLGGHGAGGGGAHAGTTSFVNNGNSNGGGGGGHSTVGMDGGAQVYAQNPFKAAAMGTGGLDYPTVPVGSAMHRLLTPSAGSGGGGGGYNELTSGNSGANYEASGAGGGAGGGFLDITAGIGISIFGEINVTGGRGGNGSAGFTTGSAGGGGGSGGGIRLLTPGDINITGATLTAAGGQGGTGIAATNAAAGYGTGPLNNGGAGGLGRLVMEDGDSLITGQGAALVLAPTEGDNGFRRGVFDAARFQGGGLEPQVTTDIFFCSPSNPAFVTPVVTDFVASIPPGSDRGVGATSCLIEVRGYQLLADGTADAVPTGWYTVGYFTHSGVVAAPNWVPGANPVDVNIPPGNSGAGIGNVNGREFLQMRITFFLPTTVGPFDPGPILDDWTLRFSFDQ